MHKWARLLKQQTLITVYRWRPMKTNFRFPFPFAGNKRQFSIPVFCLQQTTGSCRFPLVLFPILYIYVSSVYRIYAELTETATSVCLCKRKTETENFNYMLPFYDKNLTENRRPGDCTWSIYRLLILKPEVCRLSVCWRRKKRKLSVCKRTKRTKQDSPNVWKCGNHA
jgi:hypothetical protein